jgi:hypothetical protein
MARRSSKKAPGTRLLATLLLAVIAFFAGRLGWLPEPNLEPPPERADGRYHEVDYQRAWAAANDGRTEVVLKDGTRIDILTRTHALEVDFAAKWAEGVGQSLHYAAQTGRRAGIVLIMDGNTAPRHLARLQSVIQRYELPIDVFPMDAGLTNAPTSILR